MNKLLQRQGASIFALALSVAGAVQTQQQQKKTLKGNSYRNNQRLLDTLFEMLMKGRWLSWFQTH